MRVLMNLHAQVLAFDIGIYFKFNNIIIEITGTDLMIPESTLYPLHYK